MGAQSFIGPVMWYPLYLTLRYTLTSYALTNGTPWNPPATLHVVLRSFTSYGAQEIVLQVPATHPNPGGYRANERVRVRSQRV